MTSCCDAVLHPWDKYAVERRWIPETLRCLIIGESPGDSNSQYFYAAPQSYVKDRVVVRRCLLRGLCEEGLIGAATLEAFRDAGFLFDHAIRCPLSRAVVKAENRAARKYESTRVENPSHLRGMLSQAVVVWVMGHIASNAVANLCVTFPKERRYVSKAPFPGELHAGSKFFVSEYFTRWNQKEYSRICTAFKLFTLERGVFIAVSSDDR